MTADILREQWQMWRSGVLYRHYHSIIQSRPIKQVAQLWQRDSAKPETFSINVHRYSQIHAQNCIFGPPCVRIEGNVSGLFDSFDAKNFVVEFDRENASFTRKTAN